jgi:hypothetical protein
MPIPNDYRDICEMLLDATNEGRVNWIEKSSKTFVVRLPEYIFEIWSGTDELDEKIFVAVGLRDYFSESGFLDNWYVEEGDNDFDILLALFSEARRKARRLPEKLDSLRKLLKSDSTIGEVEKE